VRREDVRTAISPPCNRNRRDAARLSTTVNNPQPQRQTVDAHESDIAAVNDTPHDATRTTRHDSRRTIDARARTMRVHIDGVDVRPRYDDC
jgi:hypothetical protein